MAKKTVTKQLAEANAENTALKERLAAAEKATVEAEAAAEAANAAAANTATTTQGTTQDWIVFDEPHRRAGNRGPACKMGDIAALLKRCTEVEDADAAYEAAVREVHTLTAVVGIDPARKFRDVHKSTEMHNLCKMVRSKKRCPWMRHFVHDWATRRIMQQYMKSTRDNERKKLKLALKAAASAQASGSGHGNGSDPPDAHARHGHAARRQTTSISVNISQLNFGAEEDEEENDD
ncbi:hypothetical protein PENSPDRAFT_685176 [Peniophora sp. CONT]|nr:hypothetical protein PENSPDRAFT_685176 [Peniophora sp. CONT]